VCVSIPEGVSVPIGSAKPSHLIVSQLNITAVLVGNKKDAEAILEMAARSIVKTNYSLEPLENLTDISHNLYKRGAVNCNFLLVDANTVDATDIPAQVYREFAGQSSRYDLRVSEVPILYYIAITM
jgi:hypothetical protein